MENEVRLIDANALIQDAEDVLTFPMLDRINRAETIDPESLRPKGRWVYDDGDLEWACSECLRAAHVNLGAVYGYILSDYCPNCGADMREG